MGLDRALRRFDGVPTYALTDNEKTVSVDHVCGIAVRNPQIVQVARHYGVTITTCVPADPQSKGGSEATVQDREGRSGPDRSQPPVGLWRRSAELEAACEEWMAHVNTRPHRATHGAAGDPARRGARAVAPAPEVAAHGAASGRPGRSSWQSMISVGGALYSVPHSLIDERVWARADGDELIVVHADGPGGPSEVARHRLTTPGRPAIDDAALSAPAAGRARAPASRPLGRGAGVPRRSARPPRGG